VWLPMGNVHKCRVKGMTARVRTRLRWLETIVLVVLAALYVSNAAGQGATPTPTPIINTEMKWDQTYLYSRLATMPGGVPESITGLPVVFTNHILRSKANYQFNREFSLRLILDYNAALPNGSLVSLERSRRFGGDSLFTSLLNPGTALYWGTRIATRTCCSTPPYRRTSSDVTVRASPWADSSL
jgi:hypothetical protein